MLVAHHSGKAGVMADTRQHELLLLLSCADSPP